MSKKLEKIYSRLSKEKGSNLWVVKDGDVFIAGFSSNFMVATSVANALNVYFRSPGAYKVCEA